MNESLLDDVEVDEVEDKDNDNRVISLICTMQNKKLAIHFSEVISNILKKFDHVQEDIKVDYSDECTVNVDFKIDYDVSFEQFCDLVSIIAKPKELNEDFEYFRIIINVNSSEVDNCCLEIMYSEYKKSINLYNLKQQFNNFFKFYYPDVEYKDILETFIYSYAVISKVPIFSIEFDSKIYYLDTQKRLTNYNYVDGYAVDISKHSFIDREGNLLIVNGNESRFNGCNDFKDGYARVEKNGLWTFIDTDGNYLIKNEEDRWFHFCTDFEEGFAKVEKNGLWTFIDTDGNYLIKNEEDRWFDFCRDFKEGFATVEKDVRWTFIDTEGDYLIKNEEDRWFQCCFSFREGFAAVGNDGVWTFIDKTGKCLERQFSDCFRFKEGFAAIKKDGRMSYIDKTGNYLIKNKEDRWFKNCKEFKNGFARVMNDSEQYNYIDKNGNLVFTKWFSDPYKYTASNGLLVTDEGSYVDSDGEYVAVI